MRKKPTRLQAPGLHFHPWAWEVIPQTEACVLGYFSLSQEQQSLLSWKPSIEITSEEESIWGAPSGLTCLSDIKRQDRKAWKLEAKGATVKDYNSHHAPGHGRLRTERRLPMRP